jgi:hypothetical protein
MIVTRLRQAHVAAAVIILSTLLTVLAVREHAPLALRAPSGVILALLLPGSPWVLLTARQRRGPLETPALMVAASMAILMVTGFVLDLLPGGLTGDHWALGLAVPTLVGVVGLGIRGALEAQTPAELSFAGRVSGRPLAGWSLWRVGLAAIGTMALATILAAFAWVTLTGYSNWNHQERFTALSLNSTSPDALAVGVRNHQETTVRYSLTAVSQGRRVFSEPFTLVSGAFRSIRVKLPADTVLLDSQLRINLYRAGVPGVFRFLTLTPREGRWL